MGTAHPPRSLSTFPCWALLMPQTAPALASSTGPPLMPNQSCPCCSRMKPGCPAAPGSATVSQEAYGSGRPDLSVVVPTAHTLLPGDRNP